LEDFPIEGSPAEDAAGTDSVHGSSAPVDSAQPERGSVRERGNFAVRRSRPEAFAVDPLTGEPISEPKAVGSGGKAAVGRVPWRRVALGLGLVFALLIGATGELLYSALNRGAAPPASTAVAPTASPAVVSVATASTGPSPTAAPSPTAGPTSSEAPTSTDIANSASPGAPTPAPPVGGAPALATVTFRDLMLDSAADSGGTARTFGFATDGPGSVSAQVVTAAPLANLKICIQVNGGSSSCATGATPGLFTVAPSGGDQAQWSVTLVATDAGSTPVVDVAFSWRTRAPAITLTHGRFQGAPNPDSLRGFTATFKTRAAGSVGVVATWPPATVSAALTMTDVTTSPGSAVDQATYTSAGSISPAYAHAVTAGRTYEIHVMNTGSDSGRPDLSATISFP
jgi:hypothetical protein